MRYIAWILTGRRWSQIGSYASYEEALEQDPDAIELLSNEKSRIIYRRGDIYYPTLEETLRESGERRHVYGVA